MSILTNFDNLKLTVTVNLADQLFKQTSRDANGLCSDNVVYTNIGTGTYCVNSSKWLP